MYCVVSVVLPPTTQFITTSKCVYYNPLECPPSTCNKTVDDCGEPLEGKRWHCYALWTNKTGTVVMLMSGCWIDVEKCYDQAACISNDMSRTDESFCCCDGNFCNAKVYDIPVRTSQVPDTRTPGEYARCLQFDSLTNPSRGHSVCLLVNLRTARSVHTYG